MREGRPPSPAARSAAPAWRARGTARVRRERARRASRARSSRLGVRPVDVLEQEQRRPLGGQRLDEDARGEEQRLSVPDVSVLAETDEQCEVRGVLGRCVGADDLRDRRVELGSSLRELVAVVDARDLLHVLGEGAVRARRAVRHRSPAEYAGVLRSDMLHELDREPRLAYAGRPEDGDEVGTPLRRRRAPRFP